MWKHTWSLRESLDSGRIAHQYLVEISVSRLYYTKAFKQSADSVFVKRWLLLGLTSPTPKRGALFAGGGGGENTGGKEDQMKASRTLVCLHSSPSQLRGERRAYARARTAAKAKAAQEEASGKGE
eukprot:scaffold26932_cov22-Tisochrysis_lutea.AAC.2